MITGSRMHVMGVTDVTKGLRERAFGEYGIGCTARNHAAIEHEHMITVMLRCAPVMRHHHDRSSRIGAVAIKDGIQVELGTDVDPGGRFIKQDQLRLAHQATREVHALQFTT